ncbi:hypothetical protein [Petropleomorpha daqingensis]|uniref:Uncharacterized protein n=1 Tax=Petropleomorpha daqingensis TaxID=2026353 RepID=A0A853CGF6_9ACTN|nr:hypothetical protein [Petropleomorpha daqingensis]NYJ06306.1 hypothetical protein [Petropleomorpha daqingensis]
MSRTPQQSRFVGLWTASWLFVFLLGLLLWVGDLRVQWPALLVPVVWALVAWVRGRRRAVRRPPEDDDVWPPEDDDVPPAPRQPPTRELPWLPEVPRDRREE